MSARRSKGQIMIKKFGKMAEQYQERIDRQRDAIDRLVAANALYGDALFQIANDSKDVRAARKVATEAMEMVREVLATGEDDK